MRPILLAALVSLLLTLGGTPFAIRVFRSRGFGQLIREDIGHFHGEKRGTPTIAVTPWSKASSDRSENDLKPLISRR